MEFQEFIPPKFLFGQSADEIHSRMMSALPDRLDKSEGQFAWDFTRPVANEKAEMVQFALQNAIRGIFPMWADEDMIDYLGECRGIIRKKAAFAHGFVTVKGTKDTKISKGYEFMTAESYHQPSIGFRTTEDAVIGENGVKIPVECVLPGAVGNVGSGTILFTKEPIEGILKVDNETPTAGGIDEESTEALRTRIVEFDQSHGASFVGSIADYKRWALEVTDVGAAKVLAAEDNSGLVTIIITDSKGDAASAALCTQVYRHIMRPDEPSLRLAPVNAKLEVVTPAAQKINISADIKGNGLAGVETVKEEFWKKLKDYYKSNTDRAVFLSMVGKLLISCTGVRDYKNLKLNGAAQNVVTALDKLAVTDLSDITLTEDKSDG